MMWGASMYVNIGKYPNHFASRIQSWYMERKYGERWFEKPSPEYTVVDNIVFWIDEVVQKIYDCTINNRKQKVIVRIDDHDIWNADITLARIIHPVLCKLRCDENSFSTVDDEDVPDYLNDNETSEQKFARWHYVLDEMIFAFDYSAAIFSDDDIKYTDEEYKEMDIRTKNGLRLFGKYYQSLWT